MTRVLAFTCSRHRPIMLRHCIMQMQLQNYAVDHAVFVNSPYAATEEYTCRDYQRLLEDLHITSQGGKKLILGYGSSGTLHQNHISALRLVNHNDYDLFLKIDDDDIYLRQYVREVVDDFEVEHWDYSGAISSGVLNGYRWKPGVILTDLGLTAKDKAYEIPAVMPPTTAFSRKAIEAVFNLVDDGTPDDRQWRRYLAKTTGIKMMARRDRNFIYNVHGTNVTTSSWLESDGGQ